MISLTNSLCASVIGRSLPSTSKETEISKRHKISSSAVLLLSHTIATCGCTTPQTLPPRVKTQRKSESEFSSSSQKPLSCFPNLHTTLVTVETPPPAIWKFGKSSKYHFFEHRQKARLFDWCLFVVKTIPSLAMIFINCQPYIPRCISIHHCKLF